MASYNNYSDNWYVTVNGGAGTIYLDASLQVTGNITEVGQIVVDEAFIVAAANNSSAANVTNVGLLVGKPTDPISYAGLKYNATANAWQISTSVYANGVANASSYANINTSTYGNANLIAYSEDGWNGNIIPGFGNTYNLGNVTKIWSNVYASNGVINLLITNNIRSDDSSYVTIEDGLNVDGQIESNGNVYANFVVATGTVTGPVALANLVAEAGARAFINDGNILAANNFGNAVGNGGSNVLPVWSDGVNWYVG
jgi:hypothetical protein